jgi:hypothetical protein
MGETREAEPMTRQETFKRRIRQRMAKTGERYGAARRVLIEQADPPRPGRAWVSEPEHSDDVIRENTGRGWDEWCDLIDAWPGKDDGHAAIAAYVQQEYGIGGWWAQSITVGYERIVGLRLPFQRPDGTFSANKSRTVTVDAEALRAMLLDDDDRADLFPGVETELRSKPTSKNVRLGMGAGVAEIHMAPKGDGRVKVTIQHERLPEYGDVEHWKGYWSEWLDAIDDS